MDALRVLILQKAGAVSSGAWSSCEVTKDPGHPGPLVSKLPSGVGTLVGRSSTYAWLCNRGTTLFFTPHAGPIRGAAWSPRQGHRVRSPGLGTRAPEEQGPLGRGGPLHPRCRNGLCSLSVPDKSAIGQPHRAPDPSWACPAPPGKTQL